MPGTLGHGAVAVGGTAGFSHSYLWLVSCTLVPTKVLSIWRAAYPVHLCFPGFFCVIPSFTGRFSREALEKTWRESLTPPHSPVLLAAGMAPLHLPAGYNRGCVFLQTPGSERGCGLPFTLLSVPFPVSIYERL